MLIMAMLGVVSRGSCSIRHARSANQRVPVQKKMMPLLLKIKPKGSTEPEEYPAFTERFIYILTGTIEITLGPDKKSLKSGETLYFNAGQSHHFKNVSKSEARCLSVMTPVSL
jgi:quercetin dioxygenase-like cupin family protein